jgi:transposase
VARYHLSTMIVGIGAGENSRFTLLFEGLAIQVMQAARSIEEARKLLGLNWHQVNAIKGRAVQRGLARREEVTIPYIGIDEKQFRAGHRYISSLVDLQEGRVLDVVEERTGEACNQLIEQLLSEAQQQQVTLALKMIIGLTATGGFLDGTRSSEIDIL